MATTFTPNYNLAKPDGGPAGDFVDIGVLNANSDIIDTTLKNLNDQVGAFVSLQGAANLTVDNTVTLITWDVELEDIDGFHAAGSTGIVVPAGKAGVYMITVSGSFATSAAGTKRSLIIAKNGGAINYGDKETALSGVTPTTLTATAIVRLAVGDTVTAQILQDSGGNLFWLDDSYFAMAKLK